MLSYHALKEKPRVLRALTSLDPEAFETLLMPFEQAWQAYLNQQVPHKKSRKRRAGGGANRICWPSKISCSSFCFTSKSIPCKSHRRFLCYEPGTSQRVDSQTQSDLIVRDKT